MHSLDRLKRARPQLRVGAKFAVAVGILVLAVLGVAAIGALGLSRTHAQTLVLYNDNFQTLRRTVDVTTAIDAVSAAQLAELLPAEPGPATHPAPALLDARLIPQLAQAVQQLRQINNDTLAVNELDGLTAELAVFVQDRKSGVYSRFGPLVDSAITVTLVDRAGTLFDQMRAHNAVIQSTEIGDAAKFERQAQAGHRTTQLLLVLAVVASLLVSLVVVMALIRNLVPRIRRYSHYATAVAAGRDSGSLEPRGKDELAVLGRALDNLVAERRSAAEQEDNQTEFVDTLQVAANEDEAHELLQHHLERTIPAGRAVVLQRNNSANRLQTATPLTPDDRLAERLIAAEPRACLAVRFARTHIEGGVRAPLLPCGLCSGRGLSSTCEPLVVAGEVIGAVLVASDGPLEHAQVGLVKSSVGQAAPVLANLRSLALAEFRANSDALSGLPNKRATDDTLKRMVAQASRSVTPLTAVMLDLDHFKQINDRYGHGKGDEVLAAVGATIQASLRASDFAGRFGGEEFLLLLPDTPIEGARLLAERLRANIEGITVLGVEREITASLGLAALLTDSGSATGLLQQADRALYAAKAAGRNRVVAAGTIDPDSAAADSEQRMPVSH